MIDRSIRDYEVSIWTLQDSFITVLKQYGIESKGQIQDGNFHMSDDGTLELSFTLPMYIYQGTNNPRYFNEELDEKVVGVLENPLWHNTVNGNLIANMRKVKLIFNKGSKEEGVFEFLITKVTERHEGKNERFCDVECEGLAFHELGKIGYQVSLSSDDYYNDYEKAIKKNTTLPINNINYWCDKLFPKNSEWKYAIYMDYSGYDGIVCCKVIENGVSLIDVAHTDINRISDSEYITDEELIDYAEADDELRRQVDEWRGAHGYRLNNKIYEDAYVSSWEVNGDTVSAKTVETEKEKCRMMDESESNLYNLTQKIAETFGVFCRYEYEHDENYHIIGKKVVFYNNFLQEATGTIDLTYPYQLSSITRTMESPDLVTKMYVKSLSDSATESGECWIEDAEANKMRENYVMNFDYLHTIGTITDEQYAEIPKYEAKIRALNDQIIPLQKELEQLVVRLPEVEAKKTISENAISLDLERISANNDLLNAITNGTGIIPVNAESFYLIQDTNGSARYSLTFRKIGIIENSIEVYTDYDSSMKEFDNNDKVDNEDYVIEKDEYNNVKKLIFTFEQPLENSTKYYVKYSYSPELEYKNIRLQWENRLAQDTVENERASNEFDNLKNKIETLKKSIDNLLIEKKNAITTFERLMGPALREGNWQPDDDYAQFGDKYSDSIDDSTGLYYDMELFDDEEKGFGKYDINVTNFYYPYIALNSTDLNALEDCYNDPHLSLVVEDKEVQQVENRMKYYPINSRLKYGYVCENVTYVSSFDGNTNTWYDTPIGIEFTIPNEDNFNIEKNVKEDNVIYPYECSRDYLLEIEYQILNFDYSQTSGNADIYAVAATGASSYFSIQPVGATNYNASGSTEYIKENGTFNYKRIFHFINSSNNENRSNQYQYAKTNHKSRLKMRVRNANVGTQCIIRKISVRLCNLNNQPIGDNLCTSQASDYIKPALILTDCEDISISNINSLTSGEEISDALVSKLNNSNKAGCRISLVTYDEVTDSVTGIKSIAYKEIEKISSITTFSHFSNNAMRAYPRIEIPSLKLKLSEDELIINSDDERLYEFKDYYIMPRDESYYITLTPTRAMFSTYPLQMDYTISNTSLAIYLDALEVLKENAYPKVSYETDVSVVNPAFMHTAYKCLDKIANINDNDLRLYNVQGYISEMELNLDKPQEDSLTIKNYKTKFEDLFSSIVASTEAMQKNSNIIGLASSMLTSQGTIVPSVIKNSIMRADLDYSFNNGKLTISEGDGIWATSDDGVVAYRGGGIFTATEKDANGNWIWNTGILPQGINANLITTGQLDTNLIRIYAGDNLRLQMNGDGLFAYKDVSGDKDSPDQVADPKQYVVHNSEGLFLVAKSGAKVVDSNNVEHTILNDVERVSISWDGLKLRNYNNQEVFYASADTGDLNITGYITAKGLTIAGDDIDNTFFKNLLEAPTAGPFVCTDVNGRVYSSAKSQLFLLNSLSKETFLNAENYEYVFSFNYNIDWTNITISNPGHGLIVILNYKDSNNNSQSLTYTKGITSDNNPGFWALPLTLTQEQAEGFVNLQIECRHPNGSTYDLTIDHIQLEKGTEATAWTDTKLITTTGLASENAQNAANQAQLAAEVADGKAEAAQADIDGLQIGGRNLMLGTMTPSATAAKRPRMPNQTTNTDGLGTCTTAEHGIKWTSTTVNWQYLRWGTSVASSATLNGLTAGETYTLSCDLSWKLLSGSGTDDESICAVLYVSTDGTNIPEEDSYKIADIPSASRGTEMSARCVYTFTVPTDAVGFYLDIKSKDRTPEHYAVGDYIEARNIKLELGNRATDWTPAPEDVDSDITAIRNGTTGISFDITSGLTTIGKVDLNTNVGLLITGEKNSANKYHKFQATGNGLYFTYGIDDDNERISLLKYENGNLTIAGTFNHGFLGSNNAWEVTSDGHLNSARKFSSVGQLDQPAVSFYAGNNDNNDDSEPSIIMRSAYNQDVFAFTNGNLRIKGEITATTGKIGPWTIGENSIYYDLGTNDLNTNGSTIGTENSMYFGNAGLSISDVFKIERNTRNGAFESLHIQSPDDPTQDLLSLVPNDGKYTDENNSTESETFGYNLILNNVVLPDSLIPNNNIVTSTDYNNTFDNDNASEYPDGTLGIFYIEKHSPQPESFNISGSITNSSLANPNIAPAGDSNTYCEIYQRRWNSRYNKSSSGNLCRCGVAHTTSNTCGIRVEMGINSNMQGTTIPAQAILTCTFTLNDGQWKNGGYDQINTAIRQGIHNFILYTSTTNNNKTENKIIAQGEFKHPNVGKQLTEGNNNNRITNNTSQRIELITSQAFSITSSSSTKLYLIIYCNTSRSLTHIDTSNISITVSNASASSDYYGLFLRSNGKWQQIGNANLPSST